MKILVGFYNAEKYIIRCLDSIKKQTYKDFVCYITHDQSTDNSSDIVRNFIKDDPRFILMPDNAKKVYQVGNFDKSIRYNKDVDDNSVCVEVDGDDWLPDPEVFNRINDVYKDPDVWIANGCFQYSNGQQGFAQPQKDFKNLRTGRFTASHIRTWKAFLWRAIKEEDLKDEHGNYWQWSGDVCFMIPMLELATEKHYRFLPEINYIYNSENPINEHKLDMTMVTDHATRIRNKEPYKPLELKNNGEKKMNTITSIYVDNDEKVGRLGNKLFIIAAGLGVANKRKDCNFEIPTWKYINDFPNVPIASKVIDNLLPYQEPFFHYMKIPDNNNNLNLSGYFQSEKYFKNIEKELKEKWFLPSKELQNEIDNLFKHKGSYKITSLHVRRGDYIDKQDHHPVQTMAYFNKAMDILDNETDRYMIFSDDIEWAKENFKGDKFMFSEDRNDVTDLFMMSNCDNHIISNSSYSWWGAWLNKKEDKKVIAPKNWFGPALKLNTKDLYCDGWIVI